MTTSDGCQYCHSACPFGAPQFPDEDSGVANLVGSGGNMDKCTMCEERQDVGKGPACAEECATDAILVGTPAQISDELDNRDSGTFFNDVAMDIIFGEDASESNDEHRRPPGGVGYSRASVLISAVVGLAVAALALFWAGIPTRL